MAQQIKASFPFESLIEIGLDMDWIRRRQFQNSTLILPNGTLWVWGASHCEKFSLRPGELDSSLIILLLLKPISESCVHV